MCERHLAPWAPKARVPSRVFWGALHGMLSNPTWAYTSQDAADARARAPWPGRRQDENEGEDPNQASAAAKAACISMYFLPSDLIGAGGQTDPQAQQQNAVQVLPCPPRVEEVMHGREFAEDTEEALTVQYAENNGNNNLTAAGIVTNSAHPADQDGDAFGPADFAGGDYAAGNDGAGSRQRKRRPRRRRAAARARGDAPDWEQSWEAGSWQAASSSSVAYAAELPGGTAPAGVTSSDANPANATVAASATMPGPALPVAREALTQGGATSFTPVLSTTPMGMVPATSSVNHAVEVSSELAALHREEDDGASVVITSSDQVMGQAVASKWHSSALSAGKLSEDGHVFTKTHVGPRKSHSNGMTLSSLCMLFERTLRVGGIHQYCYSIVEGSVGAADGVGFVFDSRIRRTNIQRMRSVFLNKHGQVCIRNLDSIIKLPCSLPKLTEGVSVQLTVDLNHAAARFKMNDPTGKHCGTADLSFASLLTTAGAAAQAGDRQLSALTQANLAARSGFFCAIVTGSITVALH